MLLKNIAQIIKDYMGLSDSQIWLKNEKIPLPKDSSFSISVGFMSTGRPIGVTRRNEDNIESISITQSINVTIDIFGKTDDVILRKDEITMAMNSSQALESFAKNGFQVSRHPINTNDVSGIDGAAIPYRFQFVFAVQFTNTKTHTTDYYDQFSNEVKNAT